MCQEGFDPCQDDLGALRAEHERTKKNRLLPLVLYPSPEPRLPGDPAQREKLPAEMPPEDPSSLDLMPL
jgi:hypothetical protein